jgi:hypothetical protein
MKGAHQVAMAKVDGMVIQWIVLSYRAQIDHVFGGLYLEVLFAYRTGNNRKQKYHHKQQTKCLGSHGDVLL